MKTDDPALRIIIKGKKIDSSKSYHEVGLKRNYPGNPYDHYLKK